MELWDWTQPWELTGGAHNSFWGMSSDMCSVLGLCWAAAGDPEAWRRAVGRRAQRGGDRTGTGLLAVGRNVSLGPGSSSSLVGLWWLLAGWELSRCLLLASPPPLSAKTRGDPGYVETQRRSHVGSGWSPWGHSAPRLW